MTQERIGTIERAAQWIVGAVAAAIAAQAVWVSWFGVYDITFGRSLLLCGAVIVALLSRPAALDAEGAPRAGALFALLWAVDLALAGLSIAATVRFIEVSRLMEETLYIFSDLDILLACGGVLSLLEATRRLFGWPIVIITILVLLYAFFGPSLPGIFNHRGFDLSRAMDTIWYGFQGVFGLPLGVVIRVVLIFVVFGIVLEATGASNALIRISVALTGGTRGGPAHSAVVASAMFGSMSGSVTANVVGSGTFTIPMIKRRGFSAPMAGGIEAAASTGGQIVPPVMGAAAFLMADLTGVGYGTVAVAAILPALFYYGALFAAISVYAEARGIAPIPRAERVTLTRADYLASLLFVMPILAIVATLVIGWSPALAGFAATVTAVVMGLFRPENRRLAVIWEVLVKAGRAGASILVAVGCIGVILGVFNLTGLGLTFASAVSDYAEESLAMALLLTAFACLVLGMGMPTLPAYLIIVLVLGPVMTKLGADLIATHMFVFYFGVLSAITPPVAIGAFAAAPIAGANPMATAMTALRLAVVGFIIPFIFVYEPSLLLIGDVDPLTLGRVCLSLALAIWMLNTGLAGVGGGRLGWPERAVRLALAAGLLLPVPALNLVAIPAALAVLGLHAVVVRRRGREGDLNHSP
ncbi:MAG: TRAP transporter fused permease subunit [Pseudomonadota bacterium]